MNRKLNILTRDWSIVASVLGILLGTVVTVLNLVFSNVYTITLGPLLVTACLVYLLLRKRLALSQPSYADKNIFLLTSVLFWIAFCASILILDASRLERPLPYFLFVSIAAAVVAIQTIHYRRGAAIYLILLEIVALSLNVQASAYFVFPSIPGVDTWEHLEYVRNIISDGRIPDNPSDNAIMYYSFPVFHLNVVSHALLSGVDYKTAMFLGASLPMTLNSVLVFLIGRELLGARAGLFAMLLLSLGNHFLGRGIQPIPTSLGISFFSAMVYLLLKTQTKLVVPFTMILMLLLTGTLIATHTISTFLTLVFLASFLIGSVGYRYMSQKSGIRGNQILTLTVLLSVVATSAYWMYVAGIGDTKFFDFMIRALYSEATTTAGLGQYELTLGEPGQVLSMVGFLVLFFLAVLGFLVWLSPNELDHKKTPIFIAAFVMLSLQLGLSAFGVTNVVPDRWFSFAYVPLSIGAADGLLRLQALSSRSLGALLPASIVVIFAFFMITGKIVNMDSPVYTPELVLRDVYTEAELRLADRATAFYDGPITTDLDYGFSVLEANKKRGVSYRLLDEERTRSGLVLWRKVSISRPVRVQTKSGSNFVLGDDFARRLDSSHNLIYVNNDGGAYIHKESP